VAIYGKTLKGQKESATSKLVKEIKRKKGSMSPEKSMRAGDGAQW
jgi:hypothetical protein